MKRKKSVLKQNKAEVKRKNRGKNNQNGTLVNIEY